MAKYDSYEQCYDGLLQLWLAEDARLEDELTQIEINLYKCGFSKDMVVSYLEAQAKRDYFKDYMWEVLHWLRGRCKAGE